MMSTPVLTLVVLGPTAVVVAALFLVLWRERTSARDARIALLSGGVLAVWAVVTTVLASRGFFQPQDAESAPPVGITLVVVLSVLAASLVTSASVRRLLTRQANLIRLHLWRLVAILVLMVRGQMPALWALPAGIGDILIAVTAPWIAGQVDSPRGKRRAIVWNLLGIGDLTQVFDTVPTSELITRFPLALVPTFLVPLVFTLHVVSLWQLLGGTWAAHRPSSNTIPEVG